MNRSLFILALCFVGCGESTPSTFDATLDYADASDAASEVFSDAVEAQDVQDSSVFDHRDASMDASLGVDAVASDTPNSADAHD